MEPRNGASDAYTTRHIDFIGDVLVKCPQCGHRAAVKTPGYPQQDWEVHEEQVRFGCYRSLKVIINFSGCRFRSASDRFRPGSNGFRSVIKPVLARIHRYAKFPTLAPAIGVNNQIIHI